MSWPYPWRPDEDPDHVRADGTRNRDHYQYYMWFTAMRKKYGYPRDQHVPKWEPRFLDWELPAQSME